MQPQRVLTGVLALSIVLIASASARSGCASPPGPPLVAHWTFDEAEGPACSDAAGGVVPLLVTSSSVATLI